MRSTNQAQIQRAFTQQAADFESSWMSFSKQDYLSGMISKIGPRKSDAVLEAAAGTCACGRAIAPYAGSVVCLDMTPAMLTVGKTEAEKSGLDNMTFVLGDAAELPFLDDSFDLVVTRLAFHHFPAVEQPFAEMVRVLRPGGKLMLVDMEAAGENLRETRDEIERMRDPSHVRNLTGAEMLRLYQHHCLAVTYDEVTEIPVNLQSWLKLTKTPDAVQAEITKRFQRELSGGEQTGFAPYCEGGQIQFRQRWRMLMGEKRAAEAGVQKGEKR